MPFQEGQGISLIQLARDMSQREKVMQHCMEHLESRQLATHFDYSAFEYIYRKRNGAQANAYTLGLTAADYIISNIKILHDETGNED